MSDNLPIRVAVIITGLGIGGAELRQLTVAKSIDRKKVCMDFYCLYDEDNRLIPEFEKIGYKVYVVKVFDYTNFFLLRINFFAIFKLAKMLHQGGYDIVHTQLPQANTVGRIAAELVGIKKHIATICDMEKRSGWQRWFDKVLGKRSPTIMCISKSVREYDRLHTLFDPAKYTVIFNGIDTEKFLRENTICSVPLPALDSDIRPFIICSVARLHPLKDFPTLIQAFSIVVEHYENACLLIVGDGEEMTALKSLALQLGLKGKVIFLGERTDIPNVLACADLFVSSSLFEGFGNTIVEALSMELPVVATDIPSYREIITDQEDGFLVPAKNPASMAKSICRLITDDKKRLGYGKQGRDIVLKHFSHRLMVKRLEELYIRLGT